MKQILFVFVLTAFIFSCSSEDKSNLVIMDEASILDKNSELMQDYLEYNSYLLDEFDIDFRVLTTDSSKDINLFSTKRFRALQSRSGLGRVILLVINVAQDKTRVEVSTSLEHVFPDSFVSYIERKGMVPYFRDDKVAVGVYMMSELVKDTAMDASLRSDFMQAKASKSIGAGAKTEANLGKKDPEAKQGENISSSVEDTPADVLAKYFYALTTHNKNPGLDIYSRDTKKFLSGWTLTDVNQDNELRFNRECTKGKYYATQANAALIQPLKPRTCAPYLFKIEDGKWKLDLYTMAKVIRFNTKMMWHFDMQAKAEYLRDYEPFFQHYRYDENGYPFYRQKKKLKWGFQCDPWRKAGEKDKTRCLISWLAPDGKAKNVLGLHVGDRIMHLGNGPDALADPSFANVMQYMKDTRKGETVRLGVIRNEKYVELHAQVQ